VTAAAPALGIRRTNLARHAFGAMGTDVVLLVDREGSGHPGAAFGTVEAEFHRLEGLFSRFREDSELAILNRDGVIVASAELLDVVELAIAARDRTGGRFDPTVHDALVAAGYDRSFETLPPETEDAAGLEGAPCEGRVVVDRTRGVIELEPGFRLDLGGVAKGYAVDRVVFRLSETGPCVVNAGGDLAVRGLLGSGPWPVGVETPGGMITLALSHGAMATSGRNRRRWRRAGEERHHLIDPSTGRPSRTDLVQVTVIAASAVEAEIQAKSLLLAGEEHALREAEEIGMPCVLVTADGRALRAGGLA